MVDDSFSNQYGKIYGQDRKVIIEDIIKNICDIYPTESNLKIAYLNQDIDLSYIFWKIPSLQYQERKEGVLKTFIESKILILVSKTFLLQVVTH